MIFSYQTGLLGKIKQQQLNTEYLSEFNTDVHHALKISVQINMAAESIVSAIRNQTNATIPDYLDMDEDQRKEVHDFFCNNSDVLFEENSNNRTSLLRRKQYFNATCMYTSKYRTNDYNLRIFFFLATGKNHHLFKGETLIID